MVAVYLFKFRFVAKHYLKARPGLISFFSIYFIFSMVLEFYSIICFNLCKYYYDISFPWFLWDCTQNKNDGDVPSDYIQFIGVVLATYYFLK